MKLVVALALASLLGAVACKRAADKAEEQQTAGGGACSKAADCASGESCVFEVPGCASPHGTCKRELDHCKVNVPVCTCAKKTIFVCDATEPFERSGACEEK